MNGTMPAWWLKPRRIAVVVDNPSWVLPWAEKLVAQANRAGDRARLLRDSAEVEDDTAVAFYLGCVRITPPAVLARARRNLVVHASDLPKGRGFSPLTWQIIAGINRIPVCLLDAAESVDAGPVVYRDRIDYRGDELIDELRGPMGDMHVTLPMRFLDAATPPEGVAQQGEASVHPRRRPGDSRLDPDRPLATQFDLLRTVDNDKYPAWFDLRGHRYVLKIEKIPESGGGKP